MTIPKLPRLPPRPELAPQGSAPTGGVANGTKPGAPPATPLRDPRLGPAVGGALNVGMKLPAPAARSATTPAPPRADLAAAFEALPVTGGPGQARLLEDNREAWASRWGMLESATRTIDVGYFILEKDAFGFAFLGHLLHKARHGVKVRVQTDAMADTFGKHGFKRTLSGQDYLQELAAAGVAVKVYHPITWRLFEVFSRDFLASNHDKILVVDGVRSATGGRNIAWSYYADPEDHAAAWRDTDLHMLGAGPAQGLTEAFELEFNAPGINFEVTEDLLGNWRKRDVELLGAYLLMDAWLKGPPLSPDEKAALRRSEPLRTARAEALLGQALAGLPGVGVSRTPSRREREMLLGLAKELAGNPEQAGTAHGFDTQAELHAGPIKILDKTSQAGHEIDQINDALLALTRTAQTRIVIENPYVVLTETMIEALAEAGRRGVEIIIGTNSPLSTDSAMTQAFFLEDWPYVMARVPNLRLLVATGERKLHAKCAVFDDQLAIVSTYNMDFLSAYVNSEVAAAVWSPELAGELLQSFIDDRDNPKNGVLEYTILRDADGRPVLRDGQPVITFGPTHHLPAELLADYDKRRRLANFIRTLPWFEPLRHPPLVPPPVTLEPEPGP